jgi:hypothetical protein
MLSPTRYSRAQTQADPVTIPVEIPDRLILDTAASGAIVELYVRPDGTWAADIRIPGPPAA